MFGKGFLALEHLEIKYFRAYKLAVARSEAT